MHKAWYWLGGIAAACVIYNLDAITGQWKFEKLCKEESGPRYFEPVEKNVGWEVITNKDQDYESPFFFNHVDFVRWTDEAGKTFDVYINKDFESKLKGNQPRFFIKPIDSSKTVKYRYIYTSSALEDKRFDSSNIKILNLITNKPAASLMDFGYQWTSPDRVILNAPTRVSCSSVIESFGISFKDNIFQGDKK